MSLELASLACSVEIQKKVALVAPPDAPFLWRRVEYSCAHCEAGPGHITTEILLHTVEEHHVSAQLRLVRVDVLRAESTARCPCVAQVGKSLRASRCLSFSVDCCMSC